MEKTNLHFKIVTPERIVFEQDIKQVTVPTQQGEITILPNHIALVSVLLPGELIVVDNETTSMAVSGGFIKVADNQVVVLADTAERAEEIDETRAEEARARAQKLIEDAKDKADIDYASMAAKLEKELARLKVARKKKYKQPRGINA